MQLANHLDLARDRVYGECPLIRAFPSYFLGESLKERIGPPDGDGHHRKGSSHDGKRQLWHE